MRNVIAFFQALLPLCLFVFVAIVSIEKITFPWNYLLAIAFISIGIYASRSVYFMMSRRGVLEVMSGNEASYELDDLEPESGDGVFGREPKDLSRLFDERELEFSEGTITIWGDWEGRSLDESHTLYSIKYNEETDILTIVFTNGNVLMLKTPRSIFDAKSYFKIVKAKEVMWQVTHSEKVNLQYSYLNTGKEIITKSNTKWVPHKYDIGIGKHALYLQG